jgi:hypothetical protein
MSLYATKFKCKFPDLDPNRINIDLKWQHFGGVLFFIWSELYYKLWSMYSENKKILGNKGSWINFAKFFKYVEEAQPNG